MPRNKADTIQEQRISLSPVAAKVAMKKIEAEKEAAIWQAVGHGGGLIGIAAAAGIAGYALWKWAGLGSLTEKFTDFSKGAVNWGLDATGVSQGLDNYVAINQNYFTMKMNEIKKQCEERHAEYDAIIASPNSSENQIAQAQADKISLDRNCAKALAYWKKRAYMWMKARINNPSLVLQEGAEYWGYGSYDGAGSYSDLGPDYIPPPN